MLLIVFGKNGDDSAINKCGFGRTLLEHETSVGVPLIGLDTEVENYPHTSDLC